MTFKRVGIYPGTFDPITNGHMDIIRRALVLVDHLIVGVARNDGKGPLFSTQDRLDMVRRDVAPLNNQGASIECKVFESLLLHYAKEQGAQIIIRGLRAVSDFDYEFQMTGMNARIDPEIETVFLMAGENTQFISSRFVKEICRLNGDITGFVSKDVALRLHQHFDRV